MSTLMCQLPAKMSDVLCCFKCGCWGHICVPSGEHGKYYYILLVVLIVHGAAGARGALGLGQSVVILMVRAVDALLEDGLGLIDLKLRLEVMEMVRVAAAVGATTRVGEAELLIDYLGAKTTPVATAATILLGLLGVDTFEAVLGEELGKVILGKDSALGQAGVVLLVVLVRSSHGEDGSEVIGVAGWNTLTMRISSFEK